MVLFNLQMRGSGGRAPDGGHVREQLSAYIDYELSDAERGAVRDHLLRCPACENELATLKAAKQLLAEAPTLPLPRSFLLTPDMVGRGVTGPVVRRSWVGTLAGRLQVATASVAMLLVVLLLTDGVLTNASNAAVPQAAKQAQRTTAETQALAPAPPAASTDSALVGPTITVGLASTPAAGAVEVPRPMQAAPATSSGAVGNVPPVAPGMGDTAPVVAQPTGGAAQDATTNTYASEPTADAPAAPPAPGLNLTPLRGLEVALALLAVMLALGSLWARRQRA